MTNKVKPKIIIDARLYGPAKTGIGRYTQNLLLALKNQKNFKNFSFGLIVKNEDLTQVKKDLGKLNTEIWKSTAGTGSPNATTEETPETVPSSDCRGLGHSMMVRPPRSATNGA